MPGIVGIISKEAPRKNKRDLDRMIGRMLHEPFYVLGTYINVPFGLYVGWVSHNGAFAKCLPIFSEKKDVVLIFSGENFPSKEMVDTLRRTGCRFETNDVRSLLYLYEHIGISFLEGINGWFSGMIVDLKRKKLILFNDRFGIHRIYYHEAKDAFLFSSEAKSLLAARSYLKKVDSHALGEYFSCGCTLKDKTFFSGVSLFPGGSFWSFRDHTEIEKKRYFTPKEWENQEVLEEERFYEKLKETFLGILPCYFNPRERIAISLTGGLDTRLIMACIGKLAGELPSYTFGGIHRDTFDVLVAREVARACRQSHRVIRIGREFLLEFPEFAEKVIYITDGCHDVCGSHDLYLNGLARDVAPIRMTGKFGSEVLRGASTLKVFHYDKDFFDPEFSRIVKRGARTLEEEKRHRHRLTFTLFEEIPWYEYGCLAAEQSQVTYRTPFLDNSLLEVIYRAPEGISAKAILLRLIAETNLQLSLIKTDRGFGGDSSFFSKLEELYYWLLFKVEWYYSEGMPQWLAWLDHNLSFLQFEKLILGHNKLESYRIWYRDELAHYVRGILLDSCSLSRPYIKRKAVEELVRAHIKGDRNYTIEINKLLTIELLHRQLF